LDSAKKTVFILLLGLAVLILVSKAVWKPYVDKQSRYITDSQLSETMSQMNESLPLMVDDITRIDSVEVDGRNIIYNYTLTADLNEIVDELPTFEELRLNQLNEYCFVEGNNYFSSVNVSVTSIYRNLNGKQLNVFTLKPEECKGS
jgi:hypothetical protein